MLRFVPVDQVDARVLDIVEDRQAPLGERIIARFQCLCCLVRVEVEYVEIDVIVRPRGEMLVAAFEKLGLHK